VEDKEKYNADLDIYNAVSGAEHTYNNIMLKAKISGKKHALSIIILIAALAFTGLVDIGGVGINLALFTTSSYYIRLATRLLILVVSFNIGINLNLDKLIETSPEIKKQQELYERKSKIKENDFDTWLTDIYNTKKRKNAYILSIKAKITKLVKSASFEDKVLYNKPGLEEEKAKNKYCIQHDKLNYLITEEYMAANLEFIEVKFNEIPASDFESNITGDIVLDGDMGSTHGNPTHTKAVRTLKGSKNMIMWSILFGLLVLPSIADLFGSWDAILNLVLQLSVDSFLICKQVFYGISFTDTVVAKDYILPLANRNKVLDEYIAYKVDQPTSNATIVLNSIKEATNKTETI